MSFFSRLKFEFSINSLCIGILLLILGSGIASYALTTTSSYDVPTGALPVPVQIGKNKLIVSKTGDASMSTEYRRRRAIIGSNSCGVVPKFGYSGSTNGSLETYFLSSMCPRFKNSVVCDKLYDAGDVHADACAILDGGDAAGADQEIEIDLGDAYTTTVCFI
jgi:hypothetical protein